MARQFRSDDTSPWIDKFGNGSDGVGSINTSTDATANTTFSGTETQSTGTAGSGTGFAAGNLVLIHQSRNGGDGAGVWELNKISSVGGGTDWTLAYPLQNDYGTTGQVYLFKQYSSYTVNSGQTLTGSAWDGTKGGIIAVLVNGVATITGNITTVGKGYRGATTNADNGYAGEGTVGASVQQTTANGNGGGGGTYGTPAGTGGNAVGVAGLTTMFFGGGSGGGNEDRDGKNGAGIVLIIAKTITVTGSINGDGIAGQQGGGDQVSTGGSAGGSILLKGQVITLGTNLVTAESSAGGANGGGSNPKGSGGGGHASAGGNGSGNIGGTGSEGRIHADYLLSISGTTNPTIDSRQDLSLVGDSGGSFLLNML